MPQPNPKHDSWFESLGKDVTAVRARVGELQRSAEAEVRRDLPVVRNAAVALEQHAGHALEAGKELVEHEFEELLKALKAPVDEAKKIYHEVLEVYHYLKKWYETSYWGQAFQHIKGCYDTIGAVKETVGDFQKFLKVYEAEAEAVAASSILGPLGPGAVVLLIVAEVSILVLEMINAIVKVIAFLGDVLHANKEDMERLEGAGKVVERTTKVGQAVDPLKKAKKDVEAAEKAEKTLQRLKQIEAIEKRFVAFQAKLKPVTSRLRPLATAGEDIRKLLHHKGR